METKTPHKPPYFKYWGKAGKKEGDEISYHLLPYHCLDVAAVGKQLLQSHQPIRQGLSQLTGLEEAELIRWTVFFLALHDIGKFAISFQQLRPDLLDTLQQRKNSAHSSERHDYLGYALWNKRLKPRFQENGLIAKARRRGGFQSVDYWVNAITGHHGQPPHNRSAGFLLDDHFEQTDQDAALNFTEELISTLLGGHTPIPDISTDRAKEASWWLAGFTVLCDWLGSNADYFPQQSTEMELAAYWTIAKEQAERAVNDTELLPANPSTNLNLEQLIPTATNIDATPLQTQASELPLGDGPQLFILEDVTGAGKTEAAILLAHRLMQKKLANGVYFGLPTMATANAMYERLGDVYRRLYDDNTNPSLILAHGGRNLSDKFRQSLLPETHRPESQHNNGDSPPASLHCSQWLADNRKKALLAELGVGTIDQALLGILPSRHQSLRLLGLMHKVLLVDEVHACDAYMQPLLCNLLRAHAIAGGSAILLSATLPQSQRQQLLDAFTDGLKQPHQILQSNAYPLLTHLKDGAPVEYPLETRPTVHRHVRVDFVDSLENIEQQLANSVDSGRCACWIRNTVTDAREAYSQLKALHPEWSIDLFHARFALADRLTIEQRVLNRFGKGSDHEQRNGHILIATQVVEQSLDLDFDHLITDLAPIDLIIQRAGRLHRHRRDKNGNPIDAKDQRPEPTLTIHAPTWSDNPTTGWFKEPFPRAKAVYEDHGQLWLTMKLLRENGGFRMPEDARMLIEGVYGADHEIPDGLWKASAEAQGENRAKASIAFLNQLNLESGYTTLDANNWWDEAKTPTRLGEETTTVWLARWEDGKLTPFHDEPPFAWQQSSVSMRTALINETAPNEEIPKETIESCLEQLPAKGKWGVLLPLARETSRFWNGYSKDINGNIVSFYYACREGLMTAKEYNHLEGHNQ